MLGTDALEIFELRKSQKRKQKKQKRVIFVSKKALKNVFFFSKKRVFRVFPRLKLHPNSGEFFLKTGI